ncbi:unnamed protein product, partial [Vitis vinifera]
MNYFSLIKVGRLFERCMIFKISIGDNNAIARRKLRVRAPSVPTNPMI